MTKTTNNIEKKMSAGGPETSRLDMNQFINLASETAAEEKELSDFGEMEYEKDRDKFLKENPDLKEEDYIRKIIWLDLAKVPSISRSNLIKMLEAEFPRVYRLYKNNLNNIPTIEIKKLLDNLDRDGVPFSDGGSANGKNSMKRSDFMKLSFRDRVEKLFEIDLTGNEKLSDIQMKIRDLQPILILED